VLEKGEAWGGGGGGPAAQTKVGYRGMPAWYIPAGVQVRLSLNILVKVYNNIIMVYGHIKGSQTYMSNPDGDPSYSVL
jgi:hypothetical protein